MMTLLDRLLRLVKAIVAILFPLIAIGCHMNPDPPSSLFLSESKHAANTAFKLQISQIVLSQLYEAGLDPASDRSIDYCFYTNTEEKAKALVDELKELGYSANYSSEDREGGLVARITGITSPVPMDEDSILLWTESMCELGFEHDSKFDGWGAPVRSPDLHQ